jgi:predicted Zn-dependent protease
MYKKNLIFLILIVILLIGTSNGFTQQDFNQYQTIMAEGKIPSDFSVRTKEKVKEDLIQGRENLSRSQEKVFIEGIHYGIDELLHSGLVIYGDEISKYVNEIASHLLQNDKKTKEKLRFYTIKSNTANALSTDQGIVFVTTGLISQLTSEAQLAYILAHEIAHYTEKHVVETFEYKSHNNKGHNDRIRQLSVYSKDKEQEADIIGVSMYNKAGYSKDELLSTFDVLMYSYLPFEEIEIPKNYFNTNLLFIPEKLFPSKKYDIKAVDDYDDSESSHPNIKTRKIKAAEEIEKIANWKGDVNRLGKDRFLYIRNLSRFESVRTDILDASYADALYSIFLLEREFPNSVYLKRLKAHAWLGLAAYKNAGTINETIEKNSSLEGEVATMHYLLKNLKNEAMSTVALREIEDLNRSLENDVELKMIHQRMIHLLAHNEDFSLQHFSFNNFQKAADEYRIDQLESDSTESDKSSKKLNKYERIKQKKSNNDPSGFDSTKFYYYGLTDLIENPEFLKEYNEVKDNIKEDKDEEEKFQALSRNEQKKELKKKEELQLKLKNFILVEPMALHYKRGKIDYKGSELLEDKYSEAINTVGKDLNYSVHNISSSKLIELGTPGFNERSVLTNFLMQVIQNKDVNVLPVDLAILKKIESTYGTSKVVFTIVEHSYKPKFSGNAFYLIFFPPALVGYLPIPFLTGHTTEINLIVVDTEKAIIENAVSYIYHEPTNNLVLQARIYDILQGLHLN